MPRLTCTCRRRLIATGPQFGPVGSARALRYKMGPPHGLSKIVRQQSLLVGKAFRCNIEEGLHPRNSSAEAEAGSDIRFCNSLTFPIFRFSVRFWENHVVTPWTLNRLILSMGQGRGVRSLGSMPPDTALGTCRLDSAT